jgi:hypothetical protein
LSAGAWGKERKQRELLKLFGLDVPEEELREIR